MLLLSSSDYFQKKKNSINSFRNTFRVSNCLDPDQDRCFVGPDLGTNCLNVDYVQSTLPVKSSYKHSNVITD